MAGNFDSRHVYVQWGGKLPGGDEWSCGLRMAAAPGVTLTTDPSIMTPIATAVQAFHNDTNAQISPRAKLSFVKANLIDLDGTYVEDTTQQAIIADVAGAGTDSLTPPNQITLAVTLETGFSRGPAHRGRFYIPLPTTPVTSDGRISTGSRGPLVTAVTDFLADLNAVSANMDVAVFSRKPGAATHRVVTSAHVGLVLDTQRRRRNKLAESY